MSEVLQNILIILLPMWALIDNRGITIINHWPITVGLIAGLIMGDLKAALHIAGTFQLMSLGVAALGGSSVPDYALATVVAIYLHGRSGIDIGASVTVGLSVGILAINLDILTRTLNSFVTNKSKQLLHQKKFAQSKYINFISILFVALQGFIPMIILVLWGQTAVTSIVKIIPEWVTNGLNIAGGMLPVVGVVMLLRYMPIKQYFWAVLIGFVFSAYLKLPILGVSILGLALALFTYNYLINRNQVALNHNTIEEMGDDWDE
ncbi:PTS sugar transporter subunit IIC [Anaerococcus sp. AGMB00486]|uniref:PTS sugar transporter subunit IIC n=2 Tax=Anaerococcus TaxID=165779 RepID=A0ABX2NC16_9FIRM|nr:MULTISPECIES: PTS sugar transporter subunit IIC [Anaerococcus]MSS77827.1 PTS sugar transporter subunit IIC [Anaerococcus porci]NVF12261.1 PTS sugar transporter subunit IIC [Anaerococcus faecalis]